MLASDNDDHVADKVLPRAAGCRRLRLGLLFEYWLVFLRQIFFVGDEDGAASDSRRTGMTGALTGCGGTSSAPGGRPVDADGVQRG